MTLIAHVGTVSTAESQQLACAAKRYGFDAVSAVTPFITLSVLKSTVTIIGQSLIPQMGYRWWYTTFRR